MVFLKGLEKRKRIGRRRVSRWRRGSERQRKKFRRSRTLLHFLPSFLPGNFDSKQLNAPPEGHARGERPLVARLRQQQAAKGTLAPPARRPGGDDEGGANSPDEGSSGGSPTSRSLLRGRRRRLVAAAAAAAGLAASAEEAPSRLPRHPRARGLRPPLAARGLQASPQRFRGRRRRDAAGQGAGPRAQGGPLSRNE